METGITPVINTGIAHKKGRDRTDRCRNSKSSAFECFTKALEALAKKVRSELNESCVFEFLFRKYIVSFEKEDKGKLHSLFETSINLKFGERLINISCNNTVMPSVYRFRNTA